MSAASSITLLRTATLALACALPALGMAQVTKTQVTVATIQDLSGPIALYGKHIRNGLQMRLDEANEAGGVHGRKIVLLVEDSGYDPKKGVLAAQKLVTRDKVFALVGTIGTPVMNATMPLALDKGVLHLFPLAAARESYEPLHPYKFAFFAPYFDGMRAAVKTMAKDKNAKKVGVLYQDDDFGLEVLQGTEAGLKEIGMVIAERASYKRGATDFSSQIARLKAAGVDLVVLGTTLRETVGAAAEAKKLQWPVPMVCSTAASSAIVAKLGGAATEGLYGVQQVPTPDPETANTQLKNWMAAYKQKFGEEYETSAIYGYLAADLMLKGMQGAGPNLTNKSFSEAMEKVTTARDFFQSAGFSFSKTNHLGSRKVRLAQIQGGKWRVLGDYLD
jgi:branched-chain amino acid transport system substrate-binding protein